MFGDMPVLTWPKGLSRSFQVQSPEVTKARLDFSEAFEKHPAPHCLDGSGSPILCVRSKDIGSVMGSWWFRL